MLSYIRSFSTFPVNYEEEEEEEEEDRIGAWIYKTSCTATMLAI
jgi:hypothetical protein